MTRFKTSSLLGAAAAFRRDQVGAFSVWTAAAAFPLVLAVGVGMDIQRASRDHTDLKTALDAAVLAAVNNNAISDAERAEFAEAAFRDDYSGPPVIDIEASSRDGKVSLSATARTSLGLTAIAGLSELEVSARSAASLNTPDVICALALNETEAGAVTFTDSVSFDARTCSVQSNSDHADAIVSEAASRPVARNFCAHGGTTGGFHPSGTGECARIADPYADLQLPSAGRCSVLPTKAPSGIRDLSDVLAGDTVTAPTFVGDTGLGLPQATPVPVGFGDGSLDTSVSTINGESIVTLEPVQADDSTIINDVRTAVELVMNSRGIPRRRLEDVTWKYGEEGEEDRVRVKFDYDDDNPFSDNKKHHIPRSDVAGFLAAHHPGYDDPLKRIAPVVAVAEPMDDASFVVAVADLSDGRTVEIDNDDSHMLVDSDTILSPGTFCGGLTVAGSNVTLLPGVYHMVDGPFVVKDTATVSGEGVTVVLGGGNAHFKVESEGELKLVAPSRGATKGIVVAEDVRNPELDPEGERVRQTSRVSSGGELLVTGTVYLPTHAMEVSGDGSRLGSNAPSTSFIADTLRFGGSGLVKISVDHQEAGLPPVQPRSEDGARLIE